MRCVVASKADAFTRRRHESLWLVEARLHDGVAGVLAGVHISHALLVFFLYDFKLVLVEHLRERALLSPHVLDLLVKLAVVVLLEVGLDGAEDARESITIKSEQNALFTAHANTQRSLLVIKQGKLTKVLALAKCSYADQAGPILNRIQL